MRTALLLSFALVGMIASCGITEAASTDQCRWKGPTGSYHCEGRWCGAGPFVTPWFYGEGCFAVAG